MIEEVLAYLRNWFEYSFDLIPLEITDGKLPLPNSINGQYVRLTGSVLNDGLYVVDSYSIKLEREEPVKDVCISYLAIPQSLLDLIKEIEKWQGEQNAVSSPLESESFGGYSYTKKNAGDSGAGYSWKNEFAKRLARWKKI